MTDQEQMDWMNQCWAAFGIDYQHANLDDFRAARRASRESALLSERPMDRFIAHLVPEAAWWDPSCPS